MIIDAASEMPPHSAIVGRIPRSSVVVPINGEPNGVHP
jgi:hypothetical protein